MKLGNLKIGTRLFAAFGIMAVLILLMCGIGYRALRVIGHDIDIILEEDVPEAEATLEATISLLEAQDAMAQYLLSTDVAELVSRPLSSEPISKI